MSERLIRIIVAEDSTGRDQAVEPILSAMSRDELLAEADALEHFRKRRSNLYEQVRALFFLYAIHRFYLPLHAEGRRRGQIPYSGYQAFLKRRFEEAIAEFQREKKRAGLHQGIASALAATYHALAFQTLADQVRRSVRSALGNRWMFRVGHPSDQPLRVRPELLRQGGPNGVYPILKESTPVRMDLSHSAWSDIFFLGMDFPEGARVLNVSIDLAVRGRGESPKPPVEAYFRVIDEPVIRLVSVDLEATADIRELPELFNFGKDHLGLLKAALIASGLTPPGLESSSHSAAELLERMIGPGLGLELVSSVNNIPKGSRLAVSTNLLAALIGVCMRATGQVKSLTGPLEESDRRTVAARAILGEWLSGSGGGWQDSGGLWPGMKLIRGEQAGEGDPEFGISRGRLLPAHKILTESEAPAESREKLQQSLVLVHGGMAQNVGPILEMVTEKYLLRSAAEWEGRKEASRILDLILDHIRDGDMRGLGGSLTRNFFGPIQTIIPWASNLYTETLIEKSRHSFGEDFLGFWMLGGMSGGGMGFIFSPERRVQAQDELEKMMLETKRDLETSLPFAMDPVVYDFSINEVGSRASWLEGDQALLPASYYRLRAPALIRADAKALSISQRADLEQLAAASRTHDEFKGMALALFDRLFPKARETASSGRELTEILEQLGFDQAQHERIRSDLRSGRVGLSQNRLPSNAEIRDVEAGELIDTSSSHDHDEAGRVGEAALRNDEVAVVTLAGGVGSRWTQGAGVVKALHPFAKLSGKHRTFIETHLAKSRRTSRLYDSPVPHVFTTSYLTHDAISGFLDRRGGYGYEGSLILSLGKAVGLRMTPMERDLRYAWEELPQQELDEQKQKVRKSVQAALIDWAKSQGEGADYTDNTLNQLLHPVGHWYEAPNLLRSGALQDLLKQRPRLKWILLHNIDTVGAHVDPRCLGLHIASKNCLSFEMITRRIEDRGGGLARVDGKLRLVEGLALPNEELEFELSYYNTLTTWIDVDQFLAVFGLDRTTVHNMELALKGIRKAAARMPTYVTLKEVKKRWGHGQEDVFPVAQFEKLWGDMTALPDVRCGFLVVPRERGQQLKEQAQLDGWLRDGSAAHLERLCEWT